MFILCEFGSSTVATFHTTFEIQDGVQNGHQH